MKVIAFDFSYLLSSCSRAITFSTLIFLDGLHMNEREMSEKILELISLNASYFWGKVYNFTLGRHSVSVVMAFLSFEWFYIQFCVFLFQNSWAKWEEENEFSDTKQTIMRTLWLIKLIGLHTSRSSLCCTSIHCLFWTWIIENIRDRILCLLIFFINNSSYWKESMCSRKCAWMVNRSDFINLYLAWNFPYHRKCE